jgi:6-phosphogluconolactonase (cycloisomerase 2 family)
MKKVMRIALLALLTGSLVASCDKLPIHFPPGGGNGGGGDSNSFKEIVYVENNDTNQNAILAYVNNGDGQLQQLPGSPFYTGGTGFRYNVQQVHANASDNGIIISNDRKFLLAVNSGSNTIAVFNIHSDGTLSPVPGSPFPSGGVFPVSLAQWQQYIYVANKNKFPLQNGYPPPNYTGFRLGTNGSLTSIPGSRIDLSTNYSPTQVLVSRDNPFLFGAEFSNNISHYLINSNGTLGNLPGTAYVPAADVYGLCQHPVSDILYAGFPQEGKTAVYDIIPTTGELTYKTSVSSGNGASTMRSNSAGDRLYVLDSYDNAVSVLNTSNAEAPTVQSRLALKNPGPPYYVHGAAWTSSECYSLGLSSNEKFLYVVSQNINFDNYPPSTGNNNWFHILSVQSDGALTEPSDPIQLPVGNRIQPTGVAVYKLN